MSEQTLLHNRAGDQVRMERRIRELEGAVRDTHKMLVGLQVRYHAVATRKVSGYTVYSALNHLTWRLSKVLPKTAEEKC